MLDKREERSQAVGKVFKRKEVNKRPASESGSKGGKVKRTRWADETGTSSQLASVLGSVFE